MRTRPRELLALLADVLGVLTGAAAVLAFLVGIVALLVRVAGPASVGRFASLVAIAAGAFLLGMLTVALLTSLRLRRVVRGYEWIKASYTYWIDPIDQAHHRATTVVEIRALRDDVRVFENRYIWTGSGQEVLKARQGYHQVLSPAMFDGTYKHYFVAFNPPLASNERATIEIDHEFIDSGGTFQPFYGKMVLEPVKELCLRVLLPPGTTLDLARFEHRVSKTLGARVVARGDLPYDQSTGELVWKISGKPRVNHYYRIDWHPA